MKKLQINSVFNKRWGIGCYLLRCSDFIGNFDVAFSTQGASGALNRFCRNILAVIHRLCLAGGCVDTEVS
ncbi:MAG: hypothetical protein ACOX6U_11160 [Oscillospiraceae bacterium]